MPSAWESNSAGVQWHLELDRMPLLPGRLVGGRMRLHARHAVSARGVVVALIAEEHWRHEVTERDANGNTSTRQFALYESADVAADGATGSIGFESMPLVTGRPFRGRLQLELGDGTKLQGIRAELRVEVTATVSGGRHETVTNWAAQLAPEGAFAGSVAIDIAGDLGPRPLPTIELPHGKALATFHVILARAWAPDTHLVRDVTIATTSELSAFTGNVGPSVVRPMEGRDLAAYTRRP
jgi:hypothetical protein